MSRIPLLQEPIAEMDAVIQYDKGARYYIAPEYRFFVHKVLSKGIRRGRLLDIGTGSGRLALDFARARGCDFDITALDISPNMLKLARENARQHGVSGRIEFVLGTAAALPFPDGAFDLVVSYASLHHWFEPVKVFEEAARVTRPDGLVLVRDNKRVYDRPAWKAAIWLVSRLMNKRHRENWPKAIMASYTVPEVRTLLKQTRLNRPRVTSDFVGIDLCVEAPGGLLSK